MWRSRPSYPDWSMGDNRIKLLQATPVFGGVTEECLNFILERSSQMDIAEGGYFFHEDDAAASMFVLEIGVVSVIKHRRDVPIVLHQLKDGDCFGEIALMEMMPRSAAVRADTHCQAIELPVSVLLELYQTNLEQFTLIQMNLGREICRRLRYADACLFEALSKPKILL